MKAKIMKSLLAMVCLLGSMGASARSYFVVDGIRYSVVDESSDVDCEVAYYEDAPYSGDIVIPEKVTFDDRTYTVTRIGGNAFSGCSGLTSVSIPSTVTEILYGAFRKCTALTSIVIPNGVTYIANDTFHDCSALTSVTIPNSVEQIRGSAFEGCSALTSIDIPESVEGFAQSAFAGCSSLTNIIIPESETFLSPLTFYECSSLISIIVPNSVETVSWRAFKGCSGLKSITLGSSLHYVDTEAFYGCTSLEEIYSLNPKPAELYDVRFTSTQYETVKVYVPKGSLETYKNTSVWSRFLNISEIGEGPTGVEAVKADVEKADGTYYDIQGRKLDVPKKGLNIVNGKKVLMR